MHIFDTSILAITFKWFSKKVMIFSTNEELILMKASFSKTYI